MKRAARWISLGVVICAVTTLSAKADVLVSVPFTFKVLHPAANSGPFLSDVVFGLGVRPWPAPGDPMMVPQPMPNEVLSEFRLSAADIAETYRTDAADPDFAGLAALLTDGAADELLFMTRTFAQSAYAGAPEGTASSIRGYDDSSLAPAGAVDLAGYTLTSISERLDSLTITDNVTPDPSFPAYYGRQFTGQVTFTVEGVPGAATPEPGMAIVLPVVFAGWMARRRGR
jgi:hypothetical protein